MNQEKISALLSRYRSGSATEEDMLQIEKLLENGMLQMDDLHDINLLAEKIARLETPPPSLNLDDRFYELLASEKKSQRGFSFGEWFSINSFFTRLAYASVIFIAGLGVGYAIFHRNPTSDNDEMIALSNEVHSLKEMMMLSLLENESATDRLKAVSLSQELRESGDAVTKALIKTLNNDDNVNVRLAALEALVPYVDNSEVRQALIRSISKQDSPLVQIALAELMASLQEKSSVREFDKLLQDDKTPGEVKKRIRKSIEILI